jgi:hypothetical protein
MLTGTQKGIMSDAMAAVDYSSRTDNAFLAGLTDPFGYFLGSTTGLRLDPAGVHVLYVQIFAKGDYADSADFKAFMTAAKLVSDPDKWEDHDLDRRWADLSSAEQGPSELAIAAENTGVADVARSLGSGLSSLGSSLIVAVLGALAVVLLVRKA